MSPVVIAQRPASCGSRTSNPRRPPCRSMQAVRQRRAVREAQVPPTRVMKVTVPTVPATSSQPASIENIRSGAESQREVRQYLLFPLAIPLPVRTRVSAPTPLSWNLRPPRQPFRRQRPLPLVHVRILVLVASGLPTASIGPARTLDIYLPPYYHFDLSFVGLIPTVPPAPFLFLFLYFLFPKS